MIGELIANTIWYFVAAVVMFGSTYACAAYSKYREGVYEQWLLQQAIDLMFRKGRNPYIKGQPICATRVDSLMVRVHYPNGESEFVGLPLTMERKLKQNRQ